MANKTRVEMILQQNGIQYKERENASRTFIAIIRNQLVEIRDGGIAISVEPMYRDKLKTLIFKDIYEFTDWVKKGEFFTND
jgi:hypothetical protein